MMGLGQWGLKIRLNKVEFISFLFYFFGIAKVGIIEEQVQTPKGGGRKGSLEFLNNCGLMGFSNSYMSRTTWS